MRGGHLRSAASAATFVRAIRGELDKIPMGASLRRRTYAFGELFDIGAGYVVAKAPDGAERWRIDIVGGAKPKAELTLWHRVQDITLAMTWKELDALDRANRRLDGGLVDALNRYDPEHALAFTLAIRPVEKQSRVSA